MAREEQPREDLLAEAKNLVERVSLQPGAGSVLGAEVVAGFRRDGSLAIFFGQQRVYQFTSTAGLRRAFVDDVLYKAQAGVLIAMRRERMSDAVNLVSTPLDTRATNEFLAQMSGCLTGLQRDLEAGKYALLGQVPADGMVIERLLAWLVAHAGKTLIAASPRSA
jgi:hypothetical protein